jgi:hypothetical protein
MVENNLSHSNEGHCCRRILYDRDCFTLLICKVHRIQIYIFELFNYAIREGFNKKNLFSHIIGKVLEGIYFPQNSNNKKLYFPDIHIYEQL